MMIGLNSRSTKRRYNFTHQGREVIDRDDGTSLANALGINLDSRLGEGGVDVVNGDRVVRVGGARVLASILLCASRLSKQVQDSYSLARDVHDNAQAARLASFGHELGSDELGNWLGEINAVDEDVDCLSA